MNLRGIVSISGKPGLFKLIGQNKSGFVLESLDGKKSKTVVNLSTSKLASLEDITIFGQDDDLKLIEIFDKMKASGNIPDAKKADGTALRSFFYEVAPEHDEERVYSSDIKKIISWFNIIKELPLFEEATPAPLGETPQETEPVAAEEVVEEKPAKKATKKTKKAGE